MAHVYNMLCVASRDVSGPWWAMETDQRGLRICSNKPKLEELRKEMLSKAAPEVRYARFDDLAVSV